MLTPTFRNHALWILPVLCFLLGACQTTPAKKSTAAETVKAEKSVEPPVLPPDPLRDQLSEELRVTCELKSILKSRTATAEICACIARNHRLRLQAPDIRALVRKYQAGRQGLKPVTPEEVHLYEYDLGVATECAKNPGFVVPEEP